MDRGHVVPSSRHEIRRLVGRFGIRGRVGPLFPTRPHGDTMDRPTGFHKRLGLLLNPRPRPTGRAATGFLRTGTSLDAPRTPPADPDLPPRIAGGRPEGRGGVVAATAAERGDHPLR